jgi:hypothetical protein
MKKSLLCLILSCTALLLSAQPGKKNYPEPEFSNEVYYLQKDSIYSLIRLEKGASKMETKTKMGGFGGAEMGYTLDGEKSPVTLNSKGPLSFIISTSASSNASPSGQTDSLLQASGIDPAMMNGISGFAGMDPANMINLYKTAVSKGNRKILLQQSGGAFSKKNRASDKYTFSVKKICDGYWELVVDKVLPKGEYAFSMMATGMGGMSGDITLFAFAVH